MTGIQVFGRAPDDDEDDESAPLDVGDMCEVWDDAGALVRLAPEWWGALVVAMKRWVDTKCDTVVETMTIGGAPYVLYASKISSMVFSQHDNRVRATRKAKYLDTETRHIVTRQPWESE